MLCHIRINPIVRSQGRGSLSLCVAVAGIGITHIFVQKVPRVVFRGGDAAANFLAAGFIPGHQPAEVPPPGDDLPYDCLCRGVGIIHRKHAKLLGRFRREAVHGN